MSGRPVRVLVYLSVSDSDSVTVESEYHRISTDLAGTPGLVANELLRSPHSPRAAVMSEWTDFGAFSAWESGAAHRGTTAGLRPYQDTAHTPVFDVFEVAARH